MKKLLAFVLPVKALAAYVFAGLMCLYVVSGYLYGAIAGYAFEYYVPFIFVIEGVVLAVAVALLWAALFNEKANRRWRWFPRLIVFALALIVLLGLCLLVFAAWHTNEAKLWLFVAACVLGGVVVVSAAAEAYYRSTGKRYTQALKDYQAKADAGKEA